MFDGMTGERVAFEVAETWLEVEGAILAGRP